MNAQTPVYKILVLGIAQDGGYPQANCRKSCCESVRDGLMSGKHITSLAVIDSVNAAVWLIDCSPDLREQLDMIDTYLDGRDFEIKGILLTHAHIGHYLGLAQLGREVMGSHEINVFCMKRMWEFLRNNGPWDQLTEMNNIRLQHRHPDESILLAENLNVTAMLVPHRDEYSETVGYRIKVGQTSVLFIPDIDKWELWDRSIAEEITASDHAFLDATFYSGDELGGRSMDSIPHPSVQESMELLKDLPKEEKEKVKFIHMNHTNPILKEGSERNDLISRGFGIADQGSVIDLH